MAYENLRAAALDYQPCRYGASKLLFRGPKRRLVGDYVLFLGGIETFGKFVPKPFPARVEDRIGLTCVNFGCPNTGVEAYLSDDTVLRAARNARAVVWQLPGAQNQSNRYFTVHPRRNDRFVQARAPLRGLFPDVDLTEVHFTRHLLCQLRNTAPDRFSVVLTELQRLWSLRVGQLIQRINRPVILLWLSSIAPPVTAEDPEYSVRPSLVDRAMLDTVSAQAESLIEIVAPPAADPDGKIYETWQKPAADELPGVSVHIDIAGQVAAHLSEVLTGQSHMV